MVLLSPKKKSLYEIIIANFLKDTIIGTLIKENKKIAFLKENH